MKIYEAIKSALAIISSHRLRSALTILGIVIGIAGIIAMMSMGDGAKKLLLEEVERVGGPTMFGIYRPEFLDKDGKSERNRSKHYLTTEDLERIRADCSSVAMAIPEVDSGASVNARGKQINAGVKATTLDFQNVRKWYSEFGRFISEDDVSLWQKTCVIGTKVLNELFDGVNPIGKELKINNQRFTVVGVMESQGQEAAKNSEDNRVIIPFTTARKGAIYACNS
ncbi:ABC transporter permease [Candidatus Poribacteria bacterium]|nr:ABC transporter permease [Candidatus Poribacteria bacterium]